MGNAGQEGLFAIVVAVVGVSFVLEIPQVVGLFVLAVVAPCLGWRMWERNPFMSPRIWEGRVSGYMLGEKPTVVCRNGHHGEKTCRYFNCKEPDRPYYDELLESI